MSDDSDAPVSPEEARRRKAYLRAREIGLDRGERIDFAEFLLQHDVMTWSDLKDDQIKRLLDGMEGFALINYILSLRTRQST